MFTSGWIRGYIARNSPNDKFVRFLVNTISKEFNLKTEIWIFGSSYDIGIGQYKINIKISDAKALQNTSPYTLDKYILDNLKAQGLKFSTDRSQYIRYCYGLIKR